MGFDSYSIRKLDDDSRVNLNDVDKLICEEFKLEFNETDYGHFFFTESEEQLGSFQKSISWAGLLHVIAYYSEIKYGKNSVYDVEAAMAWIRVHAVHFPYSAIAFTSKLMRFLTDKGLYVFIDFKRSKDFDANKYTCDYNGNKMIRNESGVFDCDHNGTLLSFYPNPENLLENSVVKNSHRTYGMDEVYSPCVRTLIIPKGVHDIGERFFENGYVRDRIEFPHSLTSIGKDFSLGIFRHACLPDVVIPDSVTHIGDMAFEGCIFKSLELPHHLRSAWEQYSQGGYRLMQ